MLCIHRSYVRCLMVRREAPMNKTQPGGKKLLLLEGVHTDLAQECDTKWGIGSSGASLSHGLHFYCNAEIPHPSERAGRDTAAGFCCSCLDPYEASLDKKTFGETTHWFPVSQLNLRANADRTQLPLLKQWFSHSGLTFFWCKNDWYNKGNHHKRNLMTPTESLKGSHGKCFPGYHLFLTRRGGHMLSFESSPLFWS